MSSNRIQAKRNLDRNKKVMTAFEMRLKGATLQEIADELEVTVPTISNYIKEELEKRITPLADEERRKQLEQLDIMIKRVWLIIEEDIQLFQYGKPCFNTDGSPAIDTKRTLEATAEMRKLLDQRARLCGAYKPVQSEQTITHTTPADKALDDLVEQMEARNRRMQAELAQ